MANLNYIIGIDARDKASSKLDKIGRRAQDLGRKAAQLGAAFTAVGGAVLAFAGRQIQAVDSMAKAARAAGVSAEALQELRFAAERTGASARQVDEGLRRMNRRIGLAADGAGPAAATLERMGISVRDAGGSVKSTETVLDEFIDKLQGLGSQAEIAAAASAVFGDDAGPKLALLLAEGAGGIEKLREEARQLGIVTNEQAAGAEKAADAITNLKAAATNLTQQAAVFLAPVLTKLANIFTTAIPVAVNLSIGAIRKLRQIWLEVLASLIEKLIEVVEFFAKIELEVNKLAITLGRDFNDVSSPVSNLAQELKIAATNVSELADAYGDDATAAFDKAGEAALRYGKGADTAETETREFGASLDVTTGQVERFDSAIAELFPKFDPLKNLVAATTEEVDEFFDSLRLEQLRDAESALDGLLTEFEDLASGVDTTADDVEDLTIKVMELADTKSSLEDWGSALQEIFRGIGGEAEQAVNAVGFLLTNFERLTEVYQNGNLAQSLAAGAQLGGQFSFVGAGALGPGPSRQVGSQLGGAAGFAAFGPVGGVVGGILGSLFGGDFGEENTRIALNFGRARSAGDAGFDPRFFQNTQLGFSVAGQQITEATPEAAQIVRDVAELLNALGDIGDITGQASAESIAGALGVDRPGGNVIGPFTNVPPEQILTDIFNRALGGFSDQVRALVGPVDNLEDGFRRLGAAVDLLDVLDANPAEQAAEIIRQSSLTLTEAFEEQGAGLVELAQNYNGTTQELEALSQGTVAFNQAVVQTLVAIEQASTAIEDITAGTIDQLRFRVAGEEGGEEAQFDFLLRRAQQLFEGIGDLTDPQQIANQVGLINNLVLQASNLVPEGGLSQFLEQVEPLLQATEERAQAQLEVVREQVQSIAETTAQEIRDALGAPAQAMNTASSQMQSSSTQMENAAVRMQEASARFGQKVDQFPATIDVFFPDYQVNAG